MSFLRRWVSRVRALFSSRRDEEDFAREIDSHLQFHVDDNVRLGLTPADARRAALLKFGGLEAVKEAHRERRAFPSLGILVKDVRGGIRMLRRDPVFAAATVLTLALGVGANAVMYGLVDALVFRPPAHVRHPERVVSVSGSENYLRYLEIKDRATTVDLAAYSRSDLSLGLGPDAQMIRVECVTASFFPVLGTQAVLGRTFEEAEDRSPGTRTVVLGHGLWRRYFGGDRSILGRPVQIGARPYEVIGVAPPEFRGVELEPVDAWMLLTGSPELCSFTGRNLLWTEGGSWLRTVARLRDAAPFDTAQAELAAFGRVDGRTIDGRDVRRDVSIRPVVQSRGGATRDRQVAQWLAGGALVVLLVACANVAGLLGIRAIERRKEIAVRLQLGGSRGRVFSQLLVENLVLAGLGGGAAFVLAVGLDRVLRGFFSFAANEGFLNGRSLGVLAVFAVASALVSGLVPAFQASRTDAAGAWRTGHSTVHERSRLRYGLLVTQVALALTLAVAAGLFVQSLSRVRSDLGYDLGHVISVSIDLQKAGRRTPAETLDAFNLLLARVRQLPEVDNASLSTSGLLGSGGAGRVGSFRASLDGRPGPFLTSQGVSPEYFATVGTRVVRGRSFTAADDRTAAPVMIVDEALANEQWKGQDPVGRCAFFVQQCVEVVGVSEVRRRALTAESQEYFRPLAQVFGAETVPQVLFVRTRREAAAALPVVAAAARAVASDLPFIKVEPLEALADVRAKSWRLGATMFGLFAGVAVVLAAVGIYAMLAFSTRQQAAEIGVRMTLGATPGSVLRMVIRRGLAVVALGWVLGGVATYAAAGLIRGLLFDTAPANPTAFAGASLVIAAAGLAGSLLPALRAARIDPAATLRNE